MMKKGMLMWLVPVLLLAGCENRPEPSAAESALQVAEALGGSSEGYARAVEVRPFVFPEDHGPHPEFRNEWWYFTGNLFTAEGRRFGYQFTLFRNALAPVPEEASENTWAANQVYMGHFALTNPEEERFYFFERFSRTGGGLAGAQASPFRVWLEDWTVSGDGADPDLPMKLVAADEGVRLELSLVGGKPRVLQGNQGLSQKGAEVGNASYYYSYTRLQADGVITLGGATFAVSGTSWMDREWSTSALESGQSGWDWFALQLSDGSEVMYYQLRLKDGTPDQTSAGVWVAPDGSSQKLTRTDVSLTPTDQWTSPHTGATYPSGWTLETEDGQLQLTVQPVQPDQELQVSVHYWEGAVDVSGTAGGQAVQGQGYVELTGYAP